jgi:hypothetical protein
MAREMGQNPHSPDYGTRHRRREKPRAIADDAGRSLAFTLRATTVLPEQWRNEFGAAQAACETVIACLIPDLPRRCGKTLNATFRCISRGKLLAGWPTILWNGVFSRLFSR